MLCRAQGRICIIFKLCICFVIISFNVLIYNYIAVHFVVGRYKIQIHNTMYVMILMHCLSESTQIYVFKLRLSVGSSDFFKSFKYISIFYYTKNKVIQFFSIFRDNRKTLF